MGVEKVYIVIAETKDFDDVVAVFANEEMALGYLELKEKGKRIGTRYYYIEMPILYEY